MRNKKQRAIAALLAGIALSLPACGDSERFIEERTTTQGHGGSAVSNDPENGGGASSGPPDSAEKKCDKLSFQEPHESQAFHSLSATLNDSGQPAEIKSIQVCAFDVCIFGPPSLGGVVEVAPPAVDLRGPAFKLGDGKIFSTLAWRLPPESNIKLGEVEVISLPAPGEGEVISPGQASSSGEISLFVPSESLVDHDLLSFRSESDQLFRANWKDGLDHPSFSDGDLIVATTPEGTTFCPPGTLQVPNTRGWPTDTEMELFLHGTHLGQEHAEYGGLTSQGLGRVDESGATLLFEDIVTELGVFVVRPVER